MNNSVKERREELNMTQQELSDKSGVSRTTISKIENGVLKDIRSTTLLKIALALKCDVGDIFFKNYVVFTQQN